MQAEKTNILTIKTPEGITFSLHLAGPITRFIAWAIDVMTISVVMSVLQILLAILGLVSSNLAYAIAILLYFIVSIGYGIFFEWYWQGQTLGKKLLRLRVMDEQGLRLQFSQIVIRNLLRSVDGLPGLYLIGGLASLISKRAQRLGDIAANTIVVWHPRIREPDLSRLFEGKYNSFQNYPHLEARLRQRVEPPEAQMALQALLRRDELEPRARVGLFKQMADFFKEILEFPAEITEGLSDEQYIRNVVDTLYQTQTSGNTGCP
jgi:uncharacterized RDD family membrane protein YckC